MTFQEFKTNWENDILPNKQADIRRGQSLMLYLARVWEKEYIRLSSVHYYDWNANIDCYNNNDLIPNTLEHLEKVWNNYPN